MTNQSQLETNESVMPNQKWDMGKDASRAEIIDGVAKMHGLTLKAAAAIVGTVFDTIQENLSNGRSVNLSGFGTFEVRERQARMGVKPGTKEQIEIAGGIYPAFKPHKNFKETIQGGNRSGAAHA